MDKGHLTMLEDLLLKSYFILQITADSVFQVYQGIFHVCQHPESIIGMK